MLQKNLKIYLTYQMEKGDQKASGIDRFKNKQNKFSIGWYPTIKSLYNAALENQLKEMEAWNTEQKSKAKKND